MTNIHKISAFTSRNTAQEILATAKAIRGMNDCPTVDLYADDFCAENLPAVFADTLHTELATDAYLGPRVEYWVCELVSVEFGRKTMSRAEVIEIVGREFVLELESERAEELE